MPNPHEDVIKSALGTVEELGKLFDTLTAGNSAINKAYRTVHRALKGNLGNLEAVNEAMETLKASTRAISTEYYRSTVGVGIDQAERDRETYGLGPVSPMDEEIITPALAATMLTIEVQAERTMSLAMLEMDESYILGDQNRQGVVRPNPVIGEMKFWVTSLAMLAYSTSVSEVAEAKKQAVAQIDQHTTQTCLNVHGQMVEAGEKFHLTGTPKYASDMDTPPFHRGCRTAVALILDKFVDEKVTKKMREDAIAQGKKPKPSALAGRAHYKVVGKTVQEFRTGRWHRYKTYKNNLEARGAAASLNEAKRS